MNRTSVAEATEILKAESDQTHGKLRTLLRDKRVLVIGYSGIGDVDVSHHLRRSSAHLFWAHPEGDKPPWAQTAVESDASDVRHDKNLLLGIASMSISSSTCFTSHRPTSEIVDSWLQAGELNGERLIASLLEWRKADALLHLYLSSKEEAGFSEQLRNCGAYIQRRCYFTALARLRTLSIDEAGSKGSLAIGLLRAFALWRLGRWMSARASLFEVLTTLGYLDRNVKPISTEELDDLVEACRVYLEISRDILQFVPLKKRSKRAGAWKIQNVCDLLEDLRPRAAMDDILYKAVKMHLDSLLSGSVEESDIERLYELSMDSSYLNAAWTLVALWLQVSISSGKDAYNNLNDKLRDVGRIHYVRKNQESYIIARLQGPILRLGVFGSLLARLSIFVFYLFRTAVEEVRHGFERIRWVHWSRTWRRLRRVILEA